MEDMQREYERLYKKYSTGRDTEEKSERVPIRASIRWEVLKKQKGKCKKCGIDFLKKGINWEIDHKKSVSDGGKNTLGNLQALCPNCHTKKHHDGRVHGAGKPKHPKGRDPNDPMYVSDEISRYFR